MGGQRHVPAALTPGKEPGTHCIGGWMAPRLCPCDVEVPAGAKHNAPKTVVSELAIVAVSSRDEQEFRVIPTSMLNYADAGIPYTKLLRYTPK